MNNNSTPPDPYLAVELDVYKEYLRQNQQTFNICVGVILASLCMAIVGCFVLMKGRTIEGTVTATTGAGGLAYCFKVAQDSNKDSAKKLEKLIKDLKVPRKS